MAQTRSTAFEVHEEDLAEVRREATALLNETRGHDVPHTRYDWLYEDNPDGNAVLWSIRDQRSGQMAGFTVALPRRMLIDGHGCVCWNGADFSILPKYRTLGVAMKLRRAAKLGVDQGRVDFLYAHPNARMQVIHEKVGHFPIGTMRRYAKPLAAEAYLRRRVGNKRLAAGIGRLADVALKIRHGEMWYRPKHKMSVVRAPRFDDSFDRLFETAYAERRVVGVRDARYLDWRYTRNPLTKTDAVLAHDADRLVGYGLFIVDGKTVHLKDLLSADDPAIADDLIAKLVEHGRRLSCSSASAVVLEHSPHEKSLQRFGFVRRNDSSQMFGYTAADSDLRPIISDSRAWLGSVGDRDV